MHLEVGVKVFLKNKQGKYLVLQRSKPYPRENTCRWDIPGGRINPGEGLLSALSREVYEETGLKRIGEARVISAQDILRVKSKHTIRITYLAKADGKVRIQPKEHKAFQWVSLEELAKLDYDMYLTPVLNLLV